MASKDTYTTAELAALAHISPRTLRYYDQRGLLVPRRHANGYRCYGPADVRRLQHILMLRSCGVSLTTIDEALAAPNFDLGRMLSDHLSDLRRKKIDLEKTIATVEQAVAGLEAFETMNDQQKFEQLKRQSIETFEATYGQESRQLYGDEAIDAANERMLNMSRAAWNAKEDLEQRIKERLAAAMTSGDAASPEAHQVADMHAQWIKVHWGEGAYTPEAHVALAEGYLADARFIDYYDSACGEGATAFLRDIIKANIKGAEA